MSETPTIQTVEVQERLSAAQQMLESAAREQLSALEQYILQKAIGLFLLGKRNGYGTLHSYAAIDGLSDLSPKPRLADDDTDEVHNALKGLEQKGLLNFQPEDAEDPDIFSAIAAIREQQIVLLRNEKARL